MCTAPGQHNSNNNNKRPLTPKSMPPAGDEHTKIKTSAPNIKPSNARSKGKNTIKHTTVITTKAK